MYGCLRVQGLGFGVLCLGLVRSFGFWGVGLCFVGFEFKVQGRAFRVEGLG